MSVKDRQVIWLGASLSVLVILTVLFLLDYVTRDHVILYGWAGRRTGLMRRKGSLYGGQRAHYEFSVEERVLIRGVYLHDILRLSLLQGKLESMAGRNVTIAAIGTSIMGGAGSKYLAREVCPTTCGGVGNEYSSFFDILTNFIEDEYNVTVNTHNLATGATQVEFHSLCSMYQVLPGTDLILVENSVGTNSWDTSKRARAYERILRHLLNLPGHPAVISVNQFSYRTDDINGSFYASIENDWNVIASYYGVPVISVRNAFYENMKKGVKGFRVDYGREDLLSMNNSALNPLDYFYWDVIHPYGPTGHKYMGDLLVYLMEVVRSSNAAASETSFEMLPPMFDKNYEDEKTSCLLGDQLLHAASSNHGFSWNCMRPDRKLPSDRKCGWEATPGSWIEYSLPTPSQIFQEGNANLEVVHLKSHTNMGRFLISCKSLCKCNESLVDSHWNKSTSVFQTFELQVSLEGQGNACLVRIGTEKNNSSDSIVHIHGIILVPTHLWEFSIRDRGNEL